MTSSAFPASSHASVPTCSLSTDGLSSLLLATKQDLLQQSTTCQPTAPCQVSVPAEPRASLLYITHDCLADRFSIKYMQFLLQRPGSSSIPALLPTSQEDHSHLLPHFPLPPYPQLPSFWRPMKYHPPRDLHPTLWLTPAA